MASPSDSMDMSLSKVQGIVKDKKLQSTGSQRVRHELATDNKQKHLTLIYITVFEFLSDCLK